mmetsp:Transcript_29893/g.58685  ORF Transcript_29893/g.58685 Transcript_29893/m.58685 type:complete len:543 (-) Transcript_29893:214-1842(-)
MDFPKKWLDDWGNVAHSLLHCSKQLGNNRCLFGGCSTVFGNQTRTQGEDWEDVNLAPNNETVVLPSRDQLHLTQHLLPLQMPLISGKPRPGKGQPFSAPADDTLLGQCCCQDQSNTVQVGVCGRHFSGQCSCMEELEQQPTAMADASTTSSSEITPSKLPPNSASTALDCDREWTRATGSSSPEQCSEPMCRKAAPQHMFASRPQNNKSSHLELLMAPGDVLVVCGQGDLFEIGTIRGFLSHVMLVTSAPVSVPPSFLVKLKPLWPGDCMPEIWRVATLECTRSVAGMHSAEMLLAVTPRDRQLRILGELDKTGQVTVCFGMVELWQSPEDVRAALCADLVNSIVAGLSASQACWSATTAIRAAVMSSEPVEKSTAVETLQEIQACWYKPPICTSVVITFWQQYLCLLVARSPLDCLDMEHRSSTSFSANAVEAVGLIYKFMPLLADRTLPGDLVRSMRDCGWVCLPYLPHVFPAASSCTSQAPSAVAEHSTSVATCAPAPCEEQRQEPAWEEPSWVETVVDGHPMSQEGQGAQFGECVNPL